MSRDGYFFEGLKFLIIIFWVCADGFQGLSRTFHYPIQFLTFYLVFWIYLLILKMLTEALLRIPFSVIGRCFSLVPTSPWLQENAQQLTCHRRLPVWFTESRAASCKHFQCQNCHFRVFEQVTGRIFEISKWIQKNKLKLLFDFFIKQRKKIEKTINACTESTYCYF